MLFGAMTLLSDYLMDEFGLGMFLGSLVPVSCSIHRDFRQSHSSSQLYFQSKWLVHSMVPIVLEWDVQQAHLGKTGSHVMC